MNLRGRNAFGGTPVKLHLYVAEVDEVARRAVAPGTRELRSRISSIATAPGSFEGPCGRVRHIATRTEALSPEELKRYAAPGR